MDGETTCAVCHEPALQRTWLRCMLCGRPFHFAPEGMFTRDGDCGVVVPNPASKNGC